uniref:Phosphatidic acid phosphatase type 2/haloperoxidase domain-containing protein n=1 Tax=Oryza nivara TaxID=4536 RepID=A0A0E0IAN9_ORYNI
MHHSHRCVAHLQFSSCFLFVPLRGFTPCPRHSPASASTPLPSPHSPASPAPPPRKSTRRRRRSVGLVRLWFGLGKMPDIQLGCHTIRSHGTSVARLHMYDWIILLFLAVVDGLLNIIEPFHRFVGRDMMTDLRYPLKGNTIPFWAVPLIAIVLPWVVFGGIYFKKKNVYDLHHGILGILYSVLITAVITDAIKDGVGRPRPDFFWRCFPDGIPKFDNVTTNVICHGEKSVIKEGHKSFPRSFAGLGFLAWYLAGKLKAFDRKGHIAKLCIVFLPLLVASLVAVSRVDDYWHHWQDFFPYPFDADAVWPHAYFQQLADTQSNGIANSYNMGPTDIEIADEGHGAISLRDTSPILDTMESEKRRTFLPSSSAAGCCFRVASSLLDSCCYSASSPSIHSLSRPRGKPGNATLRATPAPRSQNCNISRRCELEEEEPLVSRQRGSEPGIMADTQLGCHTIGSHGIKVAKFHLYDWMILIFLAVVYGLFNIIEPFHRFVGSDMLTDLRYPLKGNTVPFWAVPLIAIVLPWAIFGGIYFKKKNVYDLHHGILGILYSVLITAVITDAIKNGVGRPRPDFFWRCFPDGKPNFNNVTGDVICHGERSVIKEGYKSFPSGHSSGAFAGLGFLAWYLAGKLKAFNREGHIAKLCLVFLPLLVASLVAVSRVDDYWHHWQDVFAGGIIGLTVASFCYLQFFPYPFDADAIWPHAHFQQLAESRSNGNENSHNMGWTETDAFHEGAGAVALRDTSLVLDSMESGSRF